MGLAPTICWVQRRIEVAMTNERRLSMENPFPVESLNPSIDDGVRVNQVRYQRARPASCSDVHQHYACLCMFVCSSKEFVRRFKADQSTSPAQAHRARAGTRAPALWTTAYPWRTIGIGLAQRGEAGVGTRTFTTVAQVSN